MKNILLVLIVLSPLIGAASALAARSAAVDDCGFALAYYFKDLSKAPVMSREEASEVSYAIEAEEGRIVMTVFTSPHAPKIAERWDAILAHKKFKAKTWLIDSKSKEEDRKSLVLFASALKNSKIEVTSDFIKTWTDRPFNHFFYATLAAQLLELDPQSQVATFLKTIKGLQNKLVVGNLRLAVMLAKSFRGKGMSLEDRIEAANEGLIAASQKFEARLGFQFTTYAHIWVRSKMQRDLDEHSRNVHLPVGIVHKVIRLHRETALLREALKREPAIEEIAKKMALSLEDIKDLMGISLSESYLDDSLDGSDEGGTTFGDLTSDKSIPEIEESLDHLRTQELIEKALTFLEPNEREILIKGFGLRGYDEMSNVEIGKDMKLSRERIRQIELKALAKFKAVVERLQSEKVKVVSQAAVEAGAEPAQVPEGWSQSKVILVLQELSKRRIPLSAGSIRLKTPLRIIKVIRDVTTLPSSGDTLYKAAVAIFGSWDAALRAAGLNPTEHEKYSEMNYWTAENVALFLKKLRRDGMFLHHDSIRSDNSDDFKRISKEILGIEVTGNDLIFACRKYFGTWKKALEAVLGPGPHY